MAQLTKGGELCCYKNKLKKDELQERFLKVEPDKKEKFAKILFEESAKETEPENVSSDPMGEDILQIPPNVSPQISPLISAQITPQGSPKPVFDSDDKGFEFLAMKRDKNMNKDMNKDVNEIKRQLKFGSLDSILNIEPADNQIRTEQISDYAIDIENRANRISQRNQKDEENDSNILQGPSEFIENLFFPESPQKEEDKESPEKEEKKKQLPSKKDVPESILGIPEPRPYRMGMYHLTEAENKKIKQDEVIQLLKDRIRWAQEEEQKKEDAEYHKQHMKTEKIPGGFVQEGIIDDDMKVNRDISTDFDPIINPQPADIRIMDDIGNYDFLGDFNEYDNSQDYSDDDDDDNDDEDDEYEDDDEDDEYEDDDEDDDDDDSDSTYDSSLTDQFSTDSSDIDDSIIRTPSSDEEEDDVEQKRKIITEIIYKLEKGIKVTPKEIQVVIPFFDKLDDKEYVSKVLLQILKAML